MHTRTKLLVLSVLAFVGLGLPKSAFGVAWPSVAADFARPLAELGAVITAYIIGYFLSALTSGDLARRVGAGRVLAAAGVLATVALIGYAAASAWLWLLVSAVGLGVSGGWIDAGINAHVARRHGPRAMGYLHAGFGIGATLGPAGITALLDAGTSWRWGFAALAVGQGVLAGFFLLARDGWNEADAANRPDRPRPAQRAPLVAALTMFALYAGVEVGTGQWAFTLLSEGRGIPTTLAGLAVTGFWAGLTVARLALGAFGHRVVPERVLAVSVVLALGAALALWWNPAGWAGPAALIVMGLALGPIFPLQTTLTPQRTGEAFTSLAVGYQLAAATVGGAVVPGGLGLLVAWQGLEVVGPVLAVATALLAVSIEVLRRLGGRAALV